MYHFPNVFFLEQNTPVKKQHTKFTIKLILSTQKSLAFFLCQTFPHCSPRGRQTMTASTCKKNLLLLETGRLDLRGLCKISLYSLQRWCLSHLDGQQCLARLQPFHIAQDIKYCSKSCMLSTVNSDSNQGWLLGSLLRIECSGLWSHSKSR